MTKICSFCKLEKPLYEFHYRSTIKKTLHSYCKICNILKIKLWYKNNKERAILSAKKWVRKNRKRRLEIQKRYREKGGEMLRKREKEYKIKNRERIRKLNNERTNYRFHNDPEFWVTKTMKRRIWETFKDRIVNKDKRTVEMCGCTFSELKKYLELNFQENMNWKNHGQGLNGEKQWHIDHIICLRAFNLVNKEHQLIAFHYSNLLPIWADINRKKSDILPNTRKARELTFEEKESFIKDCFENGKLKNEFVEWGKNNRVN